MRTNSLFQNPDVTNWVDNLLEKQEITLLYKAFYSIIGEDAPEYREARERFTAIAAAEILAQVIGHPTIPSIVDSGKLDKLASFLTYDQCKLRMIDLALRCVDLIQAEIDNFNFCSMLKLQESDFVSWISSLNDLRHRLRAAEKLIK